MRLSVRTFTIAALAVSIMALSGAAFAGQPPNRRPSRRKHCQGDGHHRQAAPCPSSTRPAMR